MNFFICIKWVSLQEAPERPKRQVTAKDAIGTAKAGTQTACQTAGDAIKTGTDHAKNVPGGSVLSDSVDAASTHCQDQAGAIGDAAEQVADAAGSGKWIIY